MKTLVRHAAFLALSSLILSPLSVAHASSSQAAPYQIALSEYVGGPVGVVFAR